MTRFAKTATLLSILCVAAASGTAARAEGGGLLGWVHGEWALTVGATGLVAPDFEGGKDLMFRAAPVISLGKAGPEARFVSRNDNISISLFDDSMVRAGITGKVLFPRDEDDSDALEGLDPVRWGAEIGGFAEIYPLDWLRVRGEVRQGIRAHNGLVADLSADAFHDVTETVRVSAGPRVSFASEDYFDTYYGVTAQESIDSGLSPYVPDGGGVKSYGFGGAVNWKTTDKINTSLFGEYARLTGSAADSSLVKERGSRDQFRFGVSATYRFDFTM